MSEPDFLKPEFPHLVSDCVPLLSLGQLNLKEKKASRLPNWIEVLIGGTDSENSIKLYIKVLFPAILVMSLHK